MKRNQHKESELSQMVLIFWSMMVTGSLGQIIKLSLNRDINELPAEEKKLDWWNAKVLQLF